MNAKQLLTIARHLRRRLVAWLLRRPHPTPPPRQLQLDLDELTASGLPLRDALPVRSAEYWLLLGQPHLAEAELQSLPEDTRRHAWPVRVCLAVRNVANR